MSIECAAAADPDDVASFLWDNVIARDDDYGLQMRNGGYNRVGKQLKRRDIARHVAGKQTVGTYQITQDNRVSWVMYDVDDHSGHGMSGVELALLKGTLEKQDIPYYDELSGSQGSHHIWVFLEGQTPSEIAHNWSRFVVRSSTGYALFRGEVFPKQTGLTPDKPFGNLAKVPMGVNQRNGKWSRFVDDVVANGVETVDLSSWEIQELPEMRQQGAHMGSGPNVTTERNYREPNTLIYGDVRPCIRALVDQGRRMGHRLRMAVAMEFLAVSRMSEEDVAVLCFGSQHNFDMSRTLTELRSLRGYNRPRCDTIREGCADLQFYEGFNVMDICDTCAAAGRSFRAAAAAETGVRAGQFR